MYYMQTVSEPEETLKDFKKRKFCKKERVVQSLTLSCRRIRWSFGLGFFSHWTRQRRKVVESVLTWSKIKRIYILCLLGLKWLWVPIRSEVVQITLEIALQYFFPYFYFPSLSSKLISLWNLTVLKEQKSPWPFLNRKDKEPLLTQATKVYAYTHSCFEKRVWNEFANRTL